MLKDWDEFFSSIEGKDYMKSLRAFWKKEYESKVIYPPEDMIFQAFKLTSPSKLKVVIIGQDPYINPGQAMGLAFSVPVGLKLPPSLKNIYMEIEKDLDITMDYECGDLTYLAEQGALLINAALTVEAGKSFSHQIKEYRLFMDDLMEYLDRLNQPIVFMLWGGPAKKFESKVTNPNHLILKANHPSPLSANRGGWFNMHLFSKCNEFLTENGVDAIDWKNSLSLF
ncbi:MAG: uracil-DNA glycosylase [Bacilli bacterium]|nr:uracil-DNA glycosylase [Bacilli bacterium]